MTVFAKPEQLPDAGLTRDRWGRPLIIPPGGGAPQPYLRPSSLGSVLDDSFGLNRWRIRQTVRGLAHRPDLLTYAQSKIDNDSHLNDVADKAFDAAGSDAAADHGTAIHTFTETVDRGDPLPDGLHPDVVKTLEAYRQATADLHMVATERFCVQDDVPAAGTFDRLVQLPDGTVVVADVKTGNFDARSKNGATSRLAYAHKIAIQMAVYARSVAYDPDTGQRSPLLPDGRQVYTDAGLVIHLPAKAPGMAQLWWVDLAAGWQAITLAKQVREWRATRNLTQPYAGLIHIP